jgi:hypothetical protein
MDNTENWVVIEMVDDRVLQCLDYSSRTKQEALNCAMELAMENGYSGGRNDAIDILDDDGRLFVGDWGVHLAIAE